MTPEPKSIHVLTFTDAQVLDVTGPLQVFSSANDIVRQRGLPVPYAAKVIAAQAGGIRSSAGLFLVAEALPTQPSDTLIIAGGWGVYEAAADIQLVTWIGQQATTARRVASVCSGAFLLAATGLLDGQRAVTHWSRCEDLARQYPAVQVEADAIFIQQGKLWTSAGVTAGIDLALALVEQDLGRALALEIARHLVVFLKRPGGQSQFSVALSQQQHESRFSRLHEWISQHLTHDLSLAALAEQAGMSERSLLRHYRQETGHTPARAIELIRVEAARQLLSDTAMPIKRVATQCGFGSEETLRRSFARVLAVTPQTYRERFSG
jgi:transcriptional regulator GlxA family with amidase domain